MKVVEELTELTLLVLLLGSIDAPLFDSLFVDKLLSVDGFIILELVVDDKLLLAPIVGTNDVGVVDVWTLALLTESVELELAAVGVTSVGDETDGVGEEANKLLLVLEVLVDAARTTEAFQPTDSTATAITRLALINILRNHIICLMLFSLYCLRQGELVLALARPACSLALSYLPKHV